jgi:hypothetical protein
MNNLITDFVKTEFDRCAAAIARRLDDTRTTASGRTKASLKVTVVENVFTLLGRHPFATVETGRQGGKTPINFTEILKQWAVDKQISLEPINYIRIPSDRWQPKYTPQERALNRFAGAVAHKIRTEGSKLYRDGGREDIYSEEVEKTLRTLREGLGTLIRTEVITTLNEKIGRSFKEK